MEYTLTDFLPIVYEGGTQGTDPETTLNSPAAPSQFKGGNVSPNGTFVSILGGGNVVEEGCDVVSIVGSNNKVGSGCSNIVISGSNSVSVQGGLKNVSVVNTDFVNITTSDTSWNNGTQVTLNGTIPDIDIIDAMQDQVVKISSVNVQVVDSGIDTVVAFNNPFPAYIVDAGLDQVFAGYNFKASFNQLDSTPAAKYR